MQGENRPIFIVKNEEDWKSLLQIKDAGNIYIPWFYSDQIVTIPNNTNIFVFTERVPSFIKGEITLRPADVFFKMSQSYVYDSDLERRRAENGYF